MIATIEYKASTYQLYSLMALASNIILLVLFFFEMINTPLLIGIACTLALLLLWGSFKSHQSLSKLGKITQNNYDIPLIVLLLAGFPFYFLFYGYNSLWIKQHNN